MKRKIVISFIILLILLLSQYKLLLTKYAHFFTIDNATVGAGAIVALSGGPLTRYPNAIKLYSKGYSKRILLTTPRARSTEYSQYFPNNLQIANKISGVLNTPVNFEVVPSLRKGATSTFDEAHDLLAFCTKEDLKHLIIVTDAFHTRRALYAFKKVFRESNIKIEVSAAKNDLFNEENWWWSDVGISVYALEPIKFFVYLLTNQNTSFIKNN